MAIIQQASGTFTATGWSATLPGASNAANCVVLLVGGNTTVTTPASWTLRTSQVNLMGHYLYDRAGASLTSVTVTSAAGQGTWWIAEIGSGAYQNATSQNAGSVVATSYNTTTVTPTAGVRLLLASIGSVAETGSTPRTVSGWTNSFSEQADVGQPTGDGPAQGVALLPDFTANGSTGYNTTATYSANANGRSAILGSYVTAAAGAPAIPPMLTMATRR